MEPIERDLKEVLKTGPILPFSEELRYRILQKANQKKGLRWLSMTFMPIGSFCLMTLLLLISIQNNGPVNNAVVGENPAKLSATPTNIQKESESELLHQLSWKLSPIKVNQISTDGTTVKATIANQGTVPLNNDDVQGILYFPDSNAKQANDPWYYFVDGPNVPALAPGESRDWVFKPTPVPSKNGIIDRQPHLLFVNRNEFRNQNESDLTWNESSALNHLVSITARGDEKQYVDIKMSITNSGSTAIDRNKQMAMVFFPKNEPDRDMDPFTYKYFADLSIPQGEKIDPGQTATVHLYVVTPPGVDLTKRAVHVILVDKLMNTP